MHHVSSIKLPGGLISFRPHNLVLGRIEEVGRALEGGQEGVNHI